MENQIAKANESQVELRKQTHENLLQVANLNGDEMILARAILSGRFIDLPVSRQRELILSVCAFIGVAKPTQPDFNLFTQCINERFNWIGEDELSLAFRMNSYGELKKEKIEFYGILTGDKMAEVLGYYQHVRKNAATKLMLAEKNSQYDHEPTEQEKKNYHALAVERMIDHFDAYCAAGIVPTFAFIYYDFMDEKGLFCMSQDEKDAIWKQAVEVRKQDLEIDHKNESDRIKRKDIRELIDSYLVKIKRTEKAMIRNICKKIAVLKKWDQLKADGIHLRELMIEQPINNKA